MPIKASFESGRSTFTDRDFIITAEFSDRKASLTTTIPSTQEKTASSVRIHTGVKAKLANRKFKPDHATTRTIFTQWECCVDGDSFYARTADHNHVFEIKHAKGLADFFLLLKRADKSTSGVAFPLVQGCEFLHEMYQNDQLKKDIGADVGELRQQGASQKMIDRIYRLTTFTKLNNVLNLSAHTLVHAVLDNLVAYLCLADQEQARAITQFVTPEQLLGVDGSQQKSAPMPSCQKAFADLLEEFYIDVNGPNGFRKLDGMTAEKFQLLARNVGNLRVFTDKGASPYHFAEVDIDKLAYLFGHMPDVQKSLEFVDFSLLLTQSQQPKHSPTMFAASSQTASTTSAAQQAVDPEPPKPGN